MEGGVERRIENIDGRAFISSIESEEAVKDVQDVMKKTDEKNICSGDMEI